MHRTNELECQYANKIESLYTAIKEQRSGEDAHQLSMELEKILKEFSRYRQGYYTNISVRRDLEHNTGF